MMNINEVTTPNRIDILSKDVIDILHSHCQYYLANVNPTSPLWRGLEGEIPTFGKLTIRKKRIPKDSSNIATAAFNYAFEENTGIPYVRNISTFATTVKVTAKRYGEPILVFPIDGTQFVRSTKVRDLFVDVLGTSMMSTPGKFVNQWAEKHGFTKKRLEELRSKFRTILKTTSGMIKKSQIDKLMGNDLDAWLQYISPVEKVIGSFYHYDNFHSELNRSTNELLMFGVPYYYYLDATHLHNKVEDLVSLNYDIYVGDKKIKPENYNDILLMKCIINEVEIYGIKSR